MTTAELNEIVSKHGKWLNGYADLRSADLGGANLFNANLFSANLDSANLGGADLCGANLDSANLCGANLDSANLGGADLRSANLCGANLFNANFFNTNLSKTCLDPAATSNGECSDFQPADIKGWVWGYRTRATCAAGRQLQDDRIYGCEVFSVCTTECHPGWYLWPTLEDSHNFSPSKPTHVRVRARATDIHHAGSKWRARAIWVIGDAYEKIV